MVSPRYASISTSAPATAGIRNPPAVRNTRRIREPAVKREQVVNKDIIIRYSIINCWQVYTFGTLQYRKIADKSITSDIRFQLFTPTRNFREEEKRKIRWWEILSGKTP
jgi:hypothetical protein